MECRCGSHHRKRSGRRRRHFRGYGSNRSEEQSSIVRHADYDNGRTDERFYHIDDPRGLDGPVAIGVGQHNGHAASGDFWDSLVSTLPSARAIAAKPCFLRITIKRTSGVALVIVLAFVVLLAGIVIAYLARTSTDRQLAHGTSTKRKRIS